MSTTYLIIFLHFRDLSENELTLIPRNGVSNVVLGTSIGTIMPTGNTLTNITLLEALGRHLKTINLRGNRITAIEDNTFLENPNLDTL